MGASKHSLNLHILGPTKLENRSVRQMEKYEAHDLGRPAWVRHKSPNCQLRWKNVEVRNVFNK